MFVIMSGMIIAFAIILNSFPDNLNFTEAIKMAGIGGKMEIIDFSFDIDKKHRNYGLGNISVGTNLEQMGM